MCHRRNIASCKATFQEFTISFLYLRKELKVSVSVIKCYRLAINLVSILSEMDIAANAARLPHLSLCYMECFICSCKDNPDPFVITLW